jgi:hypothetical protein
MKEVVDSLGACALAPYEYQQLESANSIRLLNILPGNPGDDIACEIFHSILNHNGKSPEYTALSYVWGSPKPQKTITCNGFTFTITPNLEGALRAVRKVDETTVMWIDQLCINQNDNDERCAQVQIMKDIYSTADETIAWLGEATCDTTVAIQFASLLSNTIDEILDSKTHHHATLMSERFEGAPMALRVDTVIRELLGEANPGWQALGRMLENK